MNGQVAIPNLMTVIDSFRGEAEFLSNFHPSPIASPAGLGIAATVEHAFQACKTRDVDEQRAILAAATPGQAKRLGRQVVLREDWEEIKVAVMRRLVEAKFEIPELREQLVATGDALLIEGNTWGDRVWGQVDGVGANHLGRILMETRAQIVASGPDSATGGEAPSSSPAAGSDDGREESR